MIRQFDAYLPENDFVADRHRQVLASLPEHFRIVSSRAADAELVTRGDVSAARVSLLENPGHSAVVKPPCGGHVIPMLSLLPRIMADPSFCRARGARFELLELTATIAVNDRASVRAVLLEVFAVYRGLTGQPPAQPELHRFRGGIAATFAALGGAPLCTLACSESRAMPGSWRLWAVGANARYSFEADEGGLARPASIRFFDGTGMSESPQSYQNADRQSWLEAHRLLANPQFQPAYGWPELSADRAVIDRLIKAEKVLATTPA